MAVYKKSNAYIIDKYETLDKANIGFGILCLYSFIGFIVPFIPSKMIYQKDEIKNARLYKFIIMSCLIGGILAGLFILMKMAPKNEDLKKSEQEIINKNT